MGEAITGRCFCGAVRFSFAAPPIAVRACWCRDCQYLSSGNASVNAAFHRADLQLSGTVSDYVSVADSGTTMRRRFCPRCGTPLFSEAASRPTLMVVRVGALDHPGMAAPASLIWKASAPAWGLDLERLPACDGQPPPLS